MILVGELLLVVHQLSGRFERLLYFGGGGRMHKPSSHHTAVEPDLHAGTEAVERDLLALSGGKFEHIQWTDGGCEVVVGVSAESACLAVCWLESGSCRGDQESMWVECVVWCCCHESVRGGGCKTKRCEIRGISLRAWQNPME